MTKEKPDDRKWDGMGWDAIPNTMKSGSGEEFCYPYTKLDG